MLGNLYKVSLIERSVYSYPSGEFSFSPSSLYPEYLWEESTLAKVDNSVYATVRDCIKQMGYDALRFGTKEWNPFGDFIKKGDTVLVKPNWVDHKNSNSNGENDLTCLVTHPSVVRAIVDYVAIALKGTGRIIIADAPMQQCNLNDLFKISGYKELFDFYKNQDLKIEIADLRKYYVEEVAHHVFTKPQLNQASEGVTVNMDGLSLHAEKDHQNPQYKVSEYELKDTATYHHNQSHSYEISKLPLESNVIINVPKPKTHRLAGMTAACKNLVGIIYEKACLPHRIIGGKESGGDAYQKVSLWKSFMEICEEKKTQQSVKGNYLKAKWYFFLTKVAYVIGYFTSGDKYRVGSWFGNDTIWRTAIDLNYALQFADKEGVLQKEQQRKIVTIGDMIIAGQGSGPVSPDSKALGMIMMSDNSLLFDRAMCEIMGFNHKKLPMFHNSDSLRKLGYDNFDQLNQEHICYNGNYISIGELNKDEWRFDAHPCWKGHIERDGV